MTDEEKREKPLGFRPYPPTKDKIGPLCKTLKVTLNYLINLAFARMTGVPESEIEKFKREMKDEQDE